MSINSGFAIWLHVRSEPVCFSETILPAYGLGSTAGEVVEARDTGRKFHARVRAFIAAHGRLKEVDLFSSACAYGMTIAVSDGSGQYLSGSTSIAESYAGMRLEWRWAEKMSPTRPFLIAFGYDVAILWSLEIRHLRYLIAVAKALSFTQASAKLRLAQSSLTRQVSNLEDEIGARLLKQNHNRVAMTDQGQWFLFDSNRLLAMCAESVAAWQKLGFGESSQP